MDTANLDLIRRYCPTLDAHTAALIAPHIVVTTEGCWEWQGKLTATGYAYLCLPPTAYGLRQGVLMHRYMYDLAVAEIVDTMRIRGSINIHHRCHNKRCISPLHLAALTPKQHKHCHKM